jgi:hypothetical protein
LGEGGVRSERGNRGEVKMKKMIMAGLLIAAAAGMCAGQTYWKKAYGDSYYSDYANAITPTADGNFIVAGSTMFSDARGYDVFLLKIKPDGDSIWTKTYGGFAEDYATAIAPTADGNFIVAGYTRSFGGVDYEFYLLKIKPDGDTIWTKTIGRSISAIATAITQTADHNFIVTGYIGSFNSWNSNIYLVKINPNGDTIWTKTYGGVNELDASAITPTADGNFIVVGDTFCGLGNFDSYLLKIKPDGSTLWTKKFGGPYNDYANAITPTADGNFIVAGSTLSFGTAYDGVYLIKIKPQGDIVWTITFDGYPNYVAKSIIPTTDGNFIVVGQFYRNDVGITYTFLFKINSKGDTLWTKTFGGPGGEGLNAIVPTSDGNFIVAGEIQNVRGEGYDALLSSLIDDRYAYKNLPFTFKIPIYDTDSLNHGYTPLKVPVGMTVSLGGTISWTPTTDSSYMDHVEFLVSDDMGKKDTLTFNIFVNSKDHPTKTINTIARSTNTTMNDLTVQQFSSKEVHFSLPVGTKSLGIYNIHGQLLENISINGAQATWRPKHAAGRYFAKAIWKKRETVKPFILMR